MTAFPSKDPSNQADWVELTLLVKQNSRLGKSQLREAIENSAPDLDDTAIETVVDEVFDEVRRRRAAGGDLYPFERRRLAIVRRDIDPKAELLYAFLALNTASPKFRQPVTSFNPGFLFEKVVAAALEHWSGGKALVFADIPAGQPTGVRAALQRLARQLAVECHPDRVRPARKDQGLDVAVWRPFPDGRAGYPILLCQCTVGWGLTSKAREVQASDWGRLLNIREGTFSAALAVPHVLAPDYAHWTEVRNSTDLILDRLRLLTLLQGVAEPWRSLTPHSSLLATGLQAWANDP